MKQFETRYSTLDDDSREVFDVMFDNALDALSTRDGAVVMVVDIEGDGIAALYTCGNQFLAAPMLRMGADVATRVDALFHSTETVQ